MRIFLGDIRHLEAVDLPCLRDLKNVIVFPRRGPQSHASEMSGGDLDGDVFWISADPQLIFKKNKDPLNYEDQEVEAKKKAQLEQDNKYTIEDVCDFFAEYIKADKSVEYTHRISSRSISVSSLGFIANSHLALADQLPSGAENEKCIQLARMHRYVSFAQADTLTVSDIYLLIVWRLTLPRMVFMLKI